MRESSAKLTQSISSSTRREGGASAKSAHDDKQFALAQIALYAAKSDIRREIRTRALIKTLHLLYIQGLLPLKANTHTHTNATCVIMIFR